MTEPQADPTSSLGTASRILSLWIFGDLLYASLPILTLALINWLRCDEFNEFHLIKEWSFAAIVLLGVAIRKMVKIKVEIQRTPDSYKLDAGVQFLVLLLVVAVLVLAFVILDEKKASAPINEPVLGAIQIILFIIGAVSLLAAVLAEEVFSANANQLPHIKSREILVRHATFRLNSAIQALDYVDYALQRLPAVPLDEDAYGLKDRQYKNWCKALVESSSDARELAEKILTASKEMTSSESTDLHNNRGLTNQVLRWLLRIATRSGRPL